MGLFHAAAAARLDWNPANSRAGFTSRETRIAASSVSKRSRRVDTARCVPLVHPPHGVTKPAGGSADCRDGPRRRGFHEQPLAVDEIGRDRTPRIDSPPGAVDVDKAKGDVMDLSLERPKGDRQLARRMFPQGFDRFNLTGTNQEINWNVHAHLLRRE